MGVNTTSREPAFRFDGFRLDRRGGLSRQHESGGLEPVILGSRALDVLTALVERNGSVVTKQELMNAAWAGVAVEDSNLAVQISALRRILDQGRVGASCIQTVIGRGYRFLPAVTVQSDASITAVAALSANSTGSQAASVQPRDAPTVTTPKSAGADPPRLSIVILPFQNLSGDRSEDYLADAITEDLTTDLSRVPGMFVIARQSAYMYQGRALDVRRVGEELGVRYVLEGSVRKLGDVLRVNAQVIATETGAHLWADRYDQQLTDPGAGQDAIVGRLGQVLKVALTDVESARGKRERPTNPDAFDLIIRAESIGLHPMGPRENAERRALLEHALRLDSTSIVAMARLALTLIRYATIGDEFERAARLIADAAAINPNHLDVLSATGFLLLHSGRYSEAISAYQRLLDEYPNSPFAYAQIGICLIPTGQAEEAILMLERAIHLDPRGEFSWSRYERLGFALLMLGRDEEAIIWTQRALAAHPNDSAFNRAQYNLRLAASHARLGHSDAARRALAEANRIWPYDTVRTHAPEDPSNRVYAAQMERYQAALRLSGHRDHAEEDADFGVASDDRLHQDLAGLTPRTAPGATTIPTGELERLLIQRKPIVIDALEHSWGRSIPGAVGLKRVGWGNSVSDSMQDRLRRKMRSLAGDDFSRPIVAVGWNSERFDGRNMALRLVALGYKNVCWYRGGREAWEVACLPETELAIQEW